MKDDQVMAYLHKESSLQGIFKLEESGAFQYTNFFIENVVVTFSHHCSITNGDPSLLG